MRRKLLGIAGIAALGAALALAPSTAEAATCKKLCKKAVNGCKKAARDVCKTLTGDAKKACRKGLKAAYANCKTTILAKCDLQPAPTACSASAAFLD